MIILLAYYKNICYLCSEGRKNIKRNHPHKMKILHGQSLTYQTNNTKGSFTCIKLLTKGIVSGIKHIHQSLLCLCLILG